MDSRRHRKSLNDHNFGIFHPILKNEGTKMIYSSRGVDCWKELSSIYFCSKNWIFGHFWVKMALVGGQKYKILNFNWLVLVCNPFRSYNFTIIKLLLKKWKLCYTLVAGPCPFLLTKPSVHRTRGEGVRRTGFLLVWIMILHIKTSAIKRIRSTAL